MEQAIDKVTRAIEYLIACLLAIMVVLVFGNVLLRYGFNSGITVSEEMARWLFVWMTFLGSIVALREHGHLGSDSLVSKLGPVGKKVCFVIGQGLMLWTTWLLLEGSFAQALINAGVEAPVSGAPVAIFYAAGVVFAIATGVVLLAQLWRVLSGQATDDELVMVQESEDLAQMEELHLDQSQTFKKH